MGRSLIRLAVIIIVFALLLEGASRLIGRRMFERLALSRKTIMEDPVLSHIWIPSMKKLDNVRSIPYFLITNKQSWAEEYDIEPKKPDNVYRIFYVGDSSVQGVVAGEYKMTEIVERELNRAHMDKDIKFEVINTGTSSYSFIQYYLLIKTKLLEYAPDLVVLNIDMTDVVNDAVYRRCALKNKEGEFIAVLPELTDKYVMMPHGYLEVKGLNLPHSLTKNSDFLYLADRIITHFLIKRHMGRIDRSADWLNKEWSEEIIENVNESMKTLSKTVALLRDNNIKVFITGVPVYPQYNGDWSARPHEVLRQAAEKEGVSYLNSCEDLKSKIKGTEQTDYFWANDESHFNIEGNRIWADAHLAFLLNPANELLPIEMPEQLK